MNQAQHLRELESIAHRYAMALQRAACQTYGEEAESAARKAKTDLTTALEAQLAAAPQAVQPRLQERIYSGEQRKAGINYVVSDGPIIWSVLATDPNAKLFVNNQPVGSGPCHIPDGAAIRCDAESIVQWVEVREATQPAAQGLTEAARSVLAERDRQIAAEGWTPEKDDAYNPGVLAEAGGIYALHAFDPRRVKETPEGWPWSPGWWKPKDPRTNLVKAGALVLAEIERIDRTYAAQAKQGGA